MQFVLANKQRSYPLIFPTPICRDGLALSAGEILAILIINKSRLFDLISQPLFLNLGMSPIWGTNPGRRCWTISTASCGRWGEDKVFMRIPYEKLYTKLGKCESLHNSQALRSVSAVGQALISCRVRPQPTIVTTIQLTNFPIQGEIIDLTYFIKEFICLFFDFIREELYPDNIYTYISSIIFCYLP